MEVQFFLLYIYIFIYKVQRHKVLAMSVLYMTQLDAISQQWYISWKGRWPSPQVSAEAPATRHAAL